MTPAQPQRPSAGAIWARSVVVWAAMLLLLLVAATTAWIPLGPFNLPIMLGCAAIELVLVGVFGMDLANSSALFRLVAITGLIWLVIMFGLTLNDFLTRSV